MTPPQLAKVVRACFCTVSAHTLISVAYVAYLLWLATGGIGSSSAIVQLDVCFAPAIAGAWIGICVGRVAGWPGSRFTPALVTAFGLISALAAVSSLGVIGLIAWVGGLDPVPLATLGSVLMAAGVASGCARPYVTTFLLVGVAVLAPLASMLGSTIPLPHIGPTGAAAAIIALAATTMLLVRVAFRLRIAGAVSRSDSVHRQPRRSLKNRLWEPAALRIAVWSAMLATGCTFAHRLPGLEWRDGPLIVVIGSVFANLSATGTSASLPRGPLPGTAWLLLSGVAKSRTDAARRLLWRIVAYSAFAAGVFTAVAIALGPDWQLVEMMLVTLAACHAYLAAACSSRWLMSSRLSVLVATPVVVAIAGGVWAGGPWGLPTAIAAFALTAVIAVHLGGLGMGRIDLDPAPQAEPAR